MSGMTANLKGFLLNNYTFSVVHIQDHARECCWPALVTIHISNYIYVGQLHPQATPSFSAVVG